jgi:hypothetical protein
MADNAQDEVCSGLRPVPRAFMIVGSSSKNFFASFNASRVAI